MFSHANLDILFAKDFYRRMLSSYRLSFNDVPFINREITELHRKEIRNSFDIIPFEMDAILSPPIF